MTDQAKKGRVIITYGRSLMALTAARSLGERGIEVIGCDDVNMTVLNFSRHVDHYFEHAPYQDNLEQYLDDLEENIRKYKPEDDRPYILMPMFRDAKILAHNRARFEGLIDIAAPNIAAIDQVNPKDTFAKTCQKHGFTIPKTRQPNTIGELQALKADITFPTLIKPRDGVGGKGIHKVKNFKELQVSFQQNIIDYTTPPLIQDIIEGEDYCLSALCDDGEIVAHMAYKNLHQFPRESGAGIMRETIDDAPFLQTAKDLLSTLQWNGIAQIDFRWSGKAEDPAYLIEVNPRFWAGLFHSVESGVDFPWLLYELTAFGKVVTEPHIEIGAKTKVPGLWTLSALQDIFDNETDFDGLKTLWQNTWKANKSPQWRDQVSELGNTLKNCIHGKNIAEQVKQLRQEGKGAKSEFSMQDDPFTGLGILFIASSLLRHGELPPEIK